MRYNQGTEYSGAITNTMPPTPDRLYSGLGVVAFRSTDGMATCDACGRTFTYPRHLAIHRLGHDDERAEVMFWAKVDRSGECWVWLGARDARGYGRLRRRGRYVKAHRYVWTITNGEIPEGLFACHHCDNPPCVRPDHLFLGTQSDNARDMVAKGRSASGALSGSYTRPDRRPRGERHGTHTRPDRIARGERLPHTILSAEDIPVIRARLAAGERTGSIGHDYGVTGAAIRDIRRGRNWKHVA